MLSLAQSPMVLAVASFVADVDAAVDAAVVAPSDAYGARDRARGSARDASNVTARNNYKLDYVASIVCILITAFDFLSKNIQITPILIYMSSYVRHKLTFTLALYNQRTPL